LRPWKTQKEKKSSKKPGTVTLVEGDQIREENSVCGEEENVRAPKKRKGSKKEIHGQYLDLLAFESVP